MDITPLVRRFADRHGLPPTFEGEAVNRQTPCDFCGSRSAIRLARMDYWDLSEHDLVHCSDCGLMQVDPMLVEKDLALGCRAFYLFEKREHGFREVRRACLRNFRKGVSLAVELKAQGFQPRRSLEIGAGDAYFSRGLKYVFPQLEVTCLDVVPEILAEIQRHHQFNTTSVTPEAMQPSELGHFDLIIGRDILEHVRQPQQVLQNIHSLLNPGGLFHFITPNGHEDVWFTYGFWQTRGQSSEHLINHVSFFPAKTLRDKLLNLGFNLRRWIIYDFKGTLRERKGRLIDPQYLAKPSAKRSAQGLIDECSQSPAFLSRLEPAEILNVPWMKNQRFAKLYCHSKHQPRWYCDADLGVGHEIYGLIERQRL